MATPNIVNVATINAKNATGAVTTSRAVAVDVSADKVAKINQINSSEVTVKISPNRYESKFTFSFNKLIETIPIDNDEWARIPNNVSLDKILLFWRYIRRNANILHITKVPIVVLIPRAMPKAIQRRLLCDKESPK